MHRPVRHLWCALPPLALALVMAAASRGFGYVADDFCFMSVRLDRGLLGPDWARAGTADRFGYRPLFLGTLLFDQALEYARPAWSAAVNHALHGAAGALVAVLALRLTASAVLGAVAGLLFVAHPIHHENLFWMSGRNHLLAAVCYFAALLCALRAAEGSRWRWHGCGAMLFAAALLSYEAAVTLPLAVALLGLTAMNGHRGTRLREAVRLAWPYALVLLAYAVFRLAFLREEVVEASPYRLERLGRNIAALGGRLLALPRVDPHTPVLASWTFWITAASAALAAGAGLQAIRWRRAVWAGAGLMAVGYLPFYLFAGYSDRLAYIASAGFVLALAGGLGPLLHGTRGRARAAGTVLVLVIGLLWLAQLQELRRDWVDAARTAETIQAQTRQLAPAPPPQARLHFWGVPDFHRVVPLYVTCFEASVIRAYGRPDLHVVRHLDAGPPGLPAGHPGAEDLLFVWDPQQLVLERLDEPWWPRAHPPPH